MKHLCNFTRSIPPGANMMEARASRLCPSSSREQSEAWLPGNSTWALVRLAWNTSPGSEGKQKQKAMWRKASRCTKCLTWEIFGDLLKFHEHLKPRMAHKQVLIGQERAVSWSQPKKKSVKQDLFTSLSLTFFTHKKVTDKEKGAEIVLIHFCKSIIQYGI